MVTVTIAQPDAITSRSRAQLAAVPITPRSSLLSQNPFPTLDADPAYGNLAMPILLPQNGTSEDSRALA